MGAESSAEPGTAPTIPDAQELRRAYTSAFAQDARISDVLRVLDAILQRDSEEDLTTAEIESSISALRDLITLQNAEIATLNTLLALLIFELLEQGIEINSKLLLNEMKQYLTKYE